MKRPLFLFFLGVLVAGPFPLMGADFAVTKEVDSNDGICDQDCSLREAILAANQNPGPDTITLPGGEFSLSLVGSDNTGALGDLDVLGDLVVSGLGAEATSLEGGGWSDRILHILNGTVTLADLAIRGGHSTEGGGGIRNEAFVTLIRCWVTGNSADESGGGIENINQLTLVSSTLSGNSAGSNGGGIYQEAGETTLLKSTVSGNVAFGSGGGIGETGGVVELRNVTIARNSSDLDRDGVGAGGGFALESSASLLSRNSLIADNRDESGVAPDCFGVIDSEGPNLIEEISGCLVEGIETGILQGEDPLLDPQLDLHGGPTRSHAILAGSPAIDRGEGDFCTGELEADQRGAERVGPCDLGAFEFIGSCEGCEEAPEAPVPSEDSSPNSDNAPPGNGSPGETLSGFGGGGCSLIR